MPQNNISSPTQTGSASNQTCPKCGTSKVRRTHRVGLSDRLFSLFNAYPYYCLECPFDTRFHRFSRK